MAAKPSSSSGLLKLEEQLTCPVCLDLYTNPKTLPCLHSFCQECLEGLPQEREARGDTYYLSCPTCRKCTELPEGGAGAFPVRKMEALDQVQPVIAEEEIENDDFQLSEVSEVAPEIGEVLQPLERDDLQLIKNGEVVESLYNIGDIVTVLQQCKVKIIQVKALPKDTAVSFSLSIETPDSFLISVPLSSLKCSLVPVGKDDEPIHTTVTTTSTPGVYKIHCNPSTSGTHTVKVQVYNSPLEDTSLAIPINPILRSITPLRTIPNIKSPWGVAVSDDGYIIVDGYYNINILDSEGNRVISHFVPIGILEAMRGIAITPERFILVAISHEIRKITMCGDYITSVGREGNGPLEFNQPAGITICPKTGQVYVADRGNHRVQPDLTFSHSFGSKGPGVGEFRSPSAIAIDNEGLVYVTDRDNNRIQRFNLDTRVATNFGSQRSGRKQLNKPVGIAIDTAGTGLVYVSEEDGNCVSVFNSDGVFVCCFGGGGNFSGPRGLTFDKEGFLYVCDHSNHRLVVY